MSYEGGDYSEQVKPTKPELKLEGNEWVLPDDTSVIEEMQSKFEQRLREVQWDEKIIQRMVLGLNEAVANAIIHGNLGIEQAPGETKESFRAKLVVAEQARRMAIIHKKAKAKHVYLNLNLTPERVVVSVRDEGKGFDPEALPDPTVPENLLRDSGRGVFIMKSLFDRVDFSGTTITMTVGSQRLPNSSSNVLASKR